MSQVGRHVFYYWMLTAITKFYYTLSLTASSLASHYTIGATGESLHHITPSSPKLRWNPLLLGQFLGSTGGGGHSLGVVPLIT